MVDTCRKVFDSVLGDRPNQIDKLREDVTVTAAQLLDVAATPGEVTEAGLRNNVSVALQYLAVWLDGTGAVGIFNLMEDAATAEISRSQIWQWRRNQVTLDTGDTVSTELVERIADEEIAKLGDPARYAAARSLVLEVALADEYVDFLTLPAYDRFS
jgi:malate synthase